jgi:hypothetical protein
MTTRRTRTRRKTGKTRIEANRPVILRATLL